MISKEICSYGEKCGDKQTQAVLTNIELGKNL